VNRKPVVLVCSAWPPGVGGAVSFALRFAQSPKLNAAFEIRKHQILKRPSIFVPTDRPWALRAMGRPMRAVSALSNFVRYFWLIVSARPDIVQFNYNGKSRGILMWEAAVYLMVARASGARTAVRLGGYDHFFELPSQFDAISKSLRRCLRHLDLLVLQCDAWSVRYEEWFRKLGVSITVATVPNTVDLAAHKRRPAGSSRQGDLRIGCIAGPETKRKGGFVLLDSLVMLSASSTCPPFRLQAAWATDAFRAAADDHELKHSVESLGHLSVQERREWLASLDVFVLPSLAEGFPNVLMEAMASGVPVVASAVGAVPHVVESGVEADLVAPGDASALAIALERLLTDPALRQRRSDAGLSAVRNRYSLHGGWDEVLVREYRCLLDRSSSPAALPQRD
jgi:glycosyltransferase involved in cell wall biosynthesis